MLEKALIGFDVGALGACWRILLGAAIPPVLRAIGIEATVGGLIAVLLAALFGVKVVAALARRVVPASDEVRSHWEWRRNLARYHDSFQWRKLLWLGIGLVASVALVPAGRHPQGLLGAACILAGCIAEVRWRVQGLRAAPTRR